MDVLFIIKVVLAIVLGMIYLLIAYSTRGLPAVKLMIVNIIAVLVFLILGFLGFMGIDIGLKKAELIGSVKQSRNLSKEQLIYYGTVKNTGKFTINTLYVTAKIVDNISAKKKVSVRGEGDSDEGSSEYKCKATTNLRKGETTSFTCTMRYPASFSLSGISYSISWN